MTNPMTTTQYSYVCAGTSLKLRQGDDARWALFCNEREVCSYSSPERAAFFVSKGNTGNSLIDRLPGRPHAIHEWQAT